MFYCRFPRFWGHQRWDFLKSDFSENLSFSKQSVPPNNFYTQIQTNESLFFLKSEIFLECHQRFFQS